MSDETQQAMQRIRDAVQAMCDARLTLNAASEVERQATIEWHNAWDAFNELK